MLLDCQIMTKIFFYSPKSQVDYIKSTLDKLKESIKDNEIDLYNKILGICNNYVWIDDYMIVKDMNSIVKRKG